MIGSPGVHGSYGLPFLIPIAVGVSALAAAGAAAAGGAALAYQSMPSPITPNSVEYQRELQMQQQQVAAMQQGYRAPEVLPGWAKVALVAGGVAVVGTLLRRR